MSKTKASIQFLEVEILQPNPFQPRNKIKKEELEGLSDSIGRHGILEPLIVAHTPAGYQIIAGERRWRAAALAGLKEVPVIIKECSPREMLELALIENVQRQDLTPMERAYSFQQLKREFGFTVGEIAERVSKSPPFVSNSLKLLTLPDAIKDGLNGGLITEGHARAISNILIKSAMIEAYKQILKEDASVRRAEEIARASKRQIGQIRTQSKHTVYQVDDEEVRRWEELIKALVETKTKVKLLRTSRLTKITITLQGKPEETQKDLETLMASTAGLKTKTDS